MKAEHEGTARGAFRARFLWVGLGLGMVLASITGYPQENSWLALPIPISNAASRMVGSSRFPRAASASPARSLFGSRTIWPQARNSEKSPVLDFAVGNTALDASLAPGLFFHGEAVFFPGVAPARAYLPELLADVRRIGVSSALAATILFTGFLMLVMLCFALAYGLQTLGIWDWASFLLVTVALILLAAAFAGIIYLKVRRLNRLRKTRESVQESIALLRRDEQAGPPSTVPR